MAVNSNEQILIRVAMEFIDSQKKLKGQIAKSTKGMKTELQAKMKVLNKDFSKEFNSLYNAPIQATKKLNLEKKKELAQANKLKSLRKTLKETLDPAVYQKVQKQYSSLRRSTKSYMSEAETMNLANKKVKKSMRDLAKTGKKVKQSFDMNALGMMFFGMAMMRVSQQIWQFGTKAFDEVSHSVEGTVTMFDMLNGSMKFLGFVVGQALEPLAALLIPIIDWLAEWVMLNPELVRGITEWGMILGAIFMVGGTLRLGIGAVIGDLKTLKGMNFEGLGAKISKGIGIVAVLWSLKEAKDAYDSFKEGAWVDGLLKAASAGLMAAGGYRLLKGKKGGGALFVLGIAFDMVAKNTLFNTIANTLGRVAAWIIALFGTSFKYLGKSFKNVFHKIFAWAAEQYAKILDALPFGIGKPGANALREIAAAQRGKTVDRGDFGADMNELFAKWNNTVQSNAAMMTEWWGNIQAESQQTQMLIAALRQGQEILNLQEGGTLTSQLGQMSPADLSFLASQAQFGTFADEESRSILADILVAMERQGQANEQTSAAVLDRLQSEFGGSTEAYLASILSGMNAYGA